MELLRCNEWIIATKYGCVILNIWEILPINCRPQNYLYICTKFHVEMQMNFSKNSFPLFWACVFQAKQIFVYICASNFMYNRFEYVYFICVHHFSLLYGRKYHTTLLYEYVYMILFGNTGLWECVIFTYILSE